jgi:hypothetical protein
VGERGDGGEVAYQLGCIAITEPVFGHRVASLFEHHTEIAGCHVGVEPVFQLTLRDHGKISNVMVFDACSGVENSGLSFIATMSSISHCFLKRSISL